MSISDPGPGAPEALPRTLRLLAERIDLSRIDHLWLFPPLRRGRKEWGLVVISEFIGGDERRHLHTARYVAEMTGSGLEYDMDLKTEGILPGERFSRVLAGVARRTEEDLGDPRAVEIGGERDNFDALLEELEAWQA